MDSIDLMNPCDRRANLAYDTDDFGEMERYDTEGSSVLAVFDTYNI